MSIGDINSDQKGSGARFNDGKVDYSLLPLATLEDEIKVWMAGAKKYSRHNWMKGMSWSAVLASCMRHLAAWQAGEDNDPETGLPHIAHAMCNLRMLTLYAKTYQEGDDREKRWVGEYRQGPGAQAKESKKDKSPAQVKDQKESPQVTLEDFLRSYGERVKAAGLEDEKKTPTGIQDWRWRDEYWLVRDGKLYKVAPPIHSPFPSPKFVPNEKMNPPLSKELSRPVTPAESNACGPGCPNCDSQSRCSGGEPNEQLLPPTNLL